MIPSCSFIRRWNPCICKLTLPALPTVATQNGMLPLLNGSRCVRKADIPPRQLVRPRPLCLYWMTRSTWVDAIANIHAECALKNCHREKQDTGIYDGYSCVFFRRSSPVVLSMSVVDVMQASSDRACSTGAPTKNRNSSLYHSHIVYLITRTKSLSVCTVADRGAPGGPDDLRGRWCASLSRSGQDGSSGHWSPVMYWRQTDGADPPQTRRRSVQRSPAKAAESSAERGSRKLGEVNRWMASVAVCTRFGYSFSIVDTFLMDYSTGLLRL